MRQTFRQEEAEQILREAVRRDMEQQAPAASVAAGAGALDVSRERLQAMAEELGITPAALEAVLRDREIAAEQRRTQESEQELRREFIQRRHADFLPHLTSYLGVNVLLIAIWFLTTPHGYFWPVWPMLGWGLGIFFHGTAALPTRGPNFEREFAGWKARRQKRQEKEAKRASQDAKKDARAAAEVELDE